MMTGVGWDMGLTGGIWMILGVVLLVALVWAVVAAVPGRERTTTTDDTAQILRSRFARGEITEQEYEQARSLLGIK